MNFKLTKGKFFLNLISMPFIWAPFPLILILDVIMEIYHRLCFPMYGIPYIKRKNFIAIDRHKLRYLNILEKIGCVYCGYVNGFVLYAGAVAQATESYWCGIRHAKRKGLVEPTYQKDFTPFGDEKAYRKKYTLKK